MDCFINVTTDSLQGKAIQFYTKQGKQDINKIIAESSITISNTSRLKNSSKLLNMLGDVSDLFKKHGLFLHQGDKNIMRRNADLLENLIDPKRLVDRINGKANFPHNVISSNKYQGSYWIVTTDEAYVKEAHFDKHEKRREKILERNLDYIDKVNQHFKSITGREGIKVTKAGKGYKVDFNDSVLLDFNSQSYTHYVNSLYKYLNDKTAVEEDLIVSPLVHKLKVEKDDTIKEKQRLNSKGVKKSTINELDNDINDLSERIDKLNKNATLEDIWDEAYDDFDQVDKLLQKESISSSEFTQAKRKLDMWSSSGDFTKETHLFLDEEEIDNQHYRDKFLDIRKEAESRMLKVLDRGKSLLETVVNNSLNTDKHLAFETIVTIPHKINAVAKRVYSLNRVGQALGQFIHKTVNEANSRAFIEAKIRSRDLAEVYKTVKDSGFDLNNFYQKDSNGNRTGRLIHKFSNQFFKSLKSIKSNIKKYKNDILFLNPAKLFESTELEKETFKLEVIKHLGEVSAEKYIKKAEDKWNEYKDIREEFIKQEFGTTNLNTEQKDVLKEWEIDNSPIEYINTIQTTKETKLSDIRGKETFIESIPKRVYKNGKETGYYDNSFNDIEANESAYELYNIAEEITNNTQSAYNYSGFTSTSLAYLEKSLIEQWNGSGASNFLTKNVYNSLVKSLTTQEATAEEIDPTTGKPKKTIKGTLVSIDQKIQTRFNEIIKEEFGSFKESTQDQREYAMNKASDEVFSSTKDNLFMALNMMNLSSLSIQHKHNIEDLVNLAVTYLPNSTVNTGNDYIDGAGNPVAQKYITNMQEMVDHFLNMTYYSEGKRDVSSTWFTARTREEKLRAKDINEKLTDQTLPPEERNNLEGELASMGAKVTTNILARKVLDFIRIKGLGWNIPAGLANLVYGKVTNLMKALDGRLFNAKELGQAERLIITQNKKFNHTVENYSILGDILFEFEENNKFEEKKNWFFRAIKSLKPYAIQTGTEKMNQGTVMIAMMLREKVKNTETGEEISMWEAISEEGKLSDEWIINGKKGRDAVVDLVSRIKSQVEEIHGDYSNPLMLKNSLAGQAIGMFKMWFFEAFHNRFGKERPDYIRGITTKGRYRTMARLLKETKGKFWKIYSAYKNNELTEVDAANMRVNMIELVAMIFSLVTAGLLKNGICGDDKDCKSANSAQLFTLNMSKRLSNEITFYLNPREWKNFITNPTAAANILGDMANLVETLGIMIDDDQENDHYQRGFYEGKHKLDVWVEKQLPFINQMQRVKKYGHEFLNL